MSSLSPINEVLGRQRARVIKGFYETHDILSLRNALMREQNLALDKHDLVIYREGINKNKVHLGNGGFETHINPPLGISEVQGLRQTLYKALLSKNPNQQILFPYRMTNLPHWVTGQILVTRDEVHLHIHDSASLYQKNSTERLEEEILNFFQSLRAQLLNFSEKTFTFEELDTTELINKLRNDGKIKRLTFINHSRSNIFKIQNRDIYCGGYTTRLICNLIKDPYLNISEPGIWGCQNKSDSDLRQEDASKIDQYGTASDIREFGSSSQGLDYNGSDEHRIKETLQSDEADKLFFEINKIINSLDTDNIKKLQSKMQILTEKLKSKKEESEEYSCVRELYRYCQIELKLGKKNPCAFFYQKPTEIITEKSFFNSTVIILNLWYRLYLSICNKTMQQIDMSQDPKIQPIGKTDPKLKYKHSSIPKPQIVAIRQQSKVTQQIQQIKLSFACESGLTESVASKKAQGINQLTQEILPELSSKGNNIYWYRSDIVCLKHLLNLAQGSDSSTKITQEDLKYIIARGDLNTKPFSILSVRDDDTKIVRTAIKILSYLAENGRKLSQEALDLLIKQLHNSDNKIAYNAMIAICFAINNGQDFTSSVFALKNWLNTLAFKIRELAKGKDRILQLPIIIMGIAALAKRRQLLTNEDFKQLKCALEYIGDEKYSFLYPLNTENNKFHSKNRIFWFPITMTSKLSKVKNVVKEKALLAKGEIDYTVASLKETNDTKCIRKAVQILKQIIVEGHRDFSDPGTVIAKLKDQSASSDRKTRLHAMMAFGYLIKDLSGKYSAYKSEFNDKFTPTRKYALAALTSFVQQHGGRKLPDAKEWLELLDKLSRDGKEEISNSAIFITASINKNVDVLEKDILEKTRSERATNMFAEAAKEGIPISPGTRVNLGLVLLKKDFPNQAKMNAVAALSYASDNGQEIPKETLKALVSYSLIVDNAAVLNAVYSILSKSNKEICKTLLDKELFVVLFKVFNHRDWIHNGICAIKNIIQSLDAVCYEKEFTEIVNNVSFLLNNGKHELETKKALLLVLLQAANKGFHFPMSVIRLLGTLCKQKDEKFLPKILETIHYLLENSKKNQKDLNFPETLVLTLIELLQYPSKNIKRTAAHLLVIYFEVTKGSISDSITRKLEYLLRDCNKSEADPEQTLFVSEILKNIVKCKCILPVSILNTLSIILIQEGNSNTLMNIAWIFSELVRKTILPEESINNLILGLKNIENDNVLELLTTSVEKLTRIKSNLNITHEIISKLAEIISDYNHTQNLRTNAAKILLNFSAQYANLRFKTEVLFLLQKVLLQGSNKSLSNTIIALLRSQMHQYHSQIIARVNLPPRREIQEILTSLEEMTFLENNLEIKMQFFQEAYCSYGYSLSTKSIDKIAKLLIISEADVPKNSNVRKFARDIVCFETKSSQLSKIALSIKEMELSCEVLRVQFQHPNKLEGAIRKIQDIASTGQLLTINCLETFENLLQSTKYSNSSKGIARIIYQAVKNNQEISVTILKSLTEVLKLEPLTEVNSVAHVFIELAKKGKYLPQETFEAFENLIFRKQKERLEDYLYVLELATSCKKDLKKSTLEQLTALLTDSNAEIQQSILRIISAAFKNQSGSKETGKTVIDTLISQLGKNQDSIAAKMFCDSLKRIIKNTSRILELDTLKQLFALFEKEISVEVEAEILEILKDISENQTLTKEMYEFIKTKQYEHIIIKESDNIKLKEAFEALCRYHHYYSPNTYKAIQKLLKLENINMVNYVIANLAARTSDLNFPDYIIIEIINDINNPKFYTESLSFIREIVNSGKKHSSSVIDSLINLMLSNADAGIRSFIYELLESLNEKKVELFNKSQQYFLDIEFAICTLSRKLNNVTASYQIEIAKFLKNINTSLTMSYNLQNFLLNLLSKKGHEFHDEIIRVLYLTKDKIFQKLQTSFLEVLINVKPSGNVDERKLNALCLYLLDTTNLETEKVHQILKQLQDKIIVNIIPDERINFLRAILDKYSVSLSDDYFALIMNCFLNSSSEALQENFISILFSILKSTRVLTPNILKSLTEASTRLIKKVHRESEKYVPGRFLSKALQQWNSYIDRQSQSDKVYHSPKIIQDFFCVLAFVYRRNPERSFDRIIKEINDCMLSQAIFQGDVQEKIEVVKKEIKNNLLLTMVSTSVSTKDLREHLKDIASCSRNLLINKLIEKVKKLSNGEEFEKYSKLFVNKLSSLERQRQYQTNSLERDNILVLLLERQEKAKLTFESLNEILDFLRYSDANPIEILIENADLKLFWLKGCLEKFCIKTSIQADVTISLALLNKLNLSIEFIASFFDKITSNENIKELEDFLTMIFHNKVRQETIASLMMLDSLRIESSYITKLICELQRRLMKEAVDSLLNSASKCKFTHKYAQIVPDLKALLLRRIDILLKNHWSFDKIYTVLKKCQDKFNANGFVNIEALYYFFDIAYCFMLNDTVIDQYEDTLLTESEAAVKELHQRAIKHHFQEGGQPKDLECLMSELRAMHDPKEASSKKPTVDKRVLENAEIFALLNDPKISTIIEKSEKIYKEGIHAWPESKIQNWVKTFKSLDMKEESLAELLAVIRRAAVLKVEKDPRQIQFISILLFLFGKQDKGRLLEIVTGEGKSLTNAMLAVICALSGEKVDIVTSTADLAKRDTETFRSFYKLFNLQVDHNEDKRYVTGLKPCYADHINIVYGCISDFQFDILRHEFSDLKTRGNRGFSRIIVDEVDSLLIDEGAKIAMLASTVPGMEGLKPLLILTALELRRILQGFSTSENGLEYYQENCIHEGEPLLSPVEDKKKFIEEKLRKYLISIMKDEKNKITFPAHLKEFVENQIIKWIKNAILAEELTERREYAIKRDINRILSVVPVDFSNTGTIQHGTSWGDGLQQFLQIKNGLEVSSESLVVNYISNIAFIKRYKNKVYGLTGTLGSSEAQKLLSEVYEHAFDYGLVPTYKNKQFLRFPNTIAATEEDWMHHIEASAIRETRNGRAALVIFETIEDAENFYKRLSKKLSSNLKLYTGDEEEFAQYLNTNIKEDTIIIATNVAGRGTDIKLDEKVIKNGGLHVCLTFLPPNKRVHMQALGRTARGGNPGTAELILNQPEIRRKLRNIIKLDEVNFEKVDMEEIEKWFDAYERACTDDFRAKGLPKATIKDELFGEFGDFLNKICKKDASVLALYNRKALEDRWGLWLKKEVDKDEFDDTPKNREVIEKEHLEIRRKFQKFKVSIEEDFSQGSIIQNPFYYINHGVELLTYASTTYRGKLKCLFTHSLYREAIKSFDCAIKLDPIHAYMAYYNKIYALVKVAKVTKGNYKDEIKNLGLKLIEIVENNILPQNLAIAHLLEISTSFKQSKVHEELTRQIKAKIESLQLLQQSTRNIIAEVELSQRLMDVCIEEPFKTTKYKKLDETQAVQVLSPLNKRITIAFNGLRSHSDGPNSYQAKNTIEVLDQELDIDIMFDGIQDKGILKQILPINRPNKAKSTQSAETAKRTSGEIESSTDAAQEKPEQSKELLHQSEIEQKKETEQNKSNEKTTLGAYASGVAQYIASGGRKIGKALKNGVEKCKTKYEETIDRWYEYGEAEKIPVTLSASYGNLNQVYALFKAITDDTYQDITITFGNLNKELIKFMRERLVTKLKIRSHTVHEKNTQSYTVTKQEKEFFEGCSVSFERLIQKDAFKLIEEMLYFLNKDEHISLYQPSVEVTFFKVSQTDAEKLIDLSPATMSLRFVSMNKENASRLIYITDKYNRNSTLVIKNLSYSVAKRLIENADRKQNDFDIVADPIENRVIHLKSSKTELSEYHVNGFINLFEIKEKKPIPWKSIFVVITLGVIQIAAGVLLSGATMGFGANFGMALIAEGLSDIVRGIAAISAREFNWGNYVLQKSISLAISLATAGYYTVQMTKVSTLATSLVDDIAMRSAGLVNNGFKFAGTQFLTASKQIITATVQKSASALVDKTLTAFCDVGLDRYKLTLRENLYGEIRKRLFDGNWKTNINKLLTIDRYLEGKHDYLKGIMLKADEMAHSIKSELIGVRLLSSTSEAMLEFDSCFLEHLEKTAAKAPSFVSLFHKKTINILEKESAGEVIRILQENNFITSDGNINLQANLSGEGGAKIEDLDFGMYQCIREQIIAFCHEYVILCEEDFSVEKREICEKLTNLLVERFFEIYKGVARVTKNGVLALTNIGVNKAADKLSKSLNSGGSGKEKVDESASGGESSAKLESANSSEKTAAPEKASTLTEPTIQGSSTNTSATKSSMTSESQTQTEPLPAKSIVPKEGAATRTSTPETTSVMKSSTTGDANADPKLSLLLERKGVSDRESIPNLKKLHLKEGDKSFVLLQEKVIHHVKRLPQSSKASGSEMISFVPVKKPDSLHLLTLNEKLDEHIKIYAEINPNTLLHSRYDTPSLIFTLQATAYATDIIVKEFCIQYEMNLKRISDLKETLAKLVVIEGGKKLSEVDDIIFEQEKKLLRLYVGIVFFDHHYHFSLRTMNLKVMNSPTHREMLNSTLNQLIVSCMQNPAKGYLNVLKCLEITPDAVKNNHLFKNLGNLFERFIRRIKERKEDEPSKTITVPTTAADTQANLNKTLDRYFESLKNQNYSECQNLFLSGELGTNGFIAGRLIEGYITVAQKSDQYHHRTQLILLNLIKAIVKDQDKFQTQLLEIRNIYTKLTKIIEGCYKGVADSSANKIIELQDNLTKMALDPAISDATLMEAQRSTAHSQTEIEVAVKSYYETFAALIKSNGIPEKFVTQCIQMRGTIIKSITGSITEIARYKKPDMKLLLEQNRSLISAMLSINTDYKSEQVDPVQVSKAYKR